MNANDELIQQLIELQYGLLDDAEAASLKGRIEAEPAIAQAWVEAQRVSGLFATAARLEAPPVKLVRPAEPRIAIDAVRFSEDGAPARRDRSVRWVQWCLATAAALLLLVTGGGYIQHRASEVDVAANHLRLIVTGPATLTQGAPSQFAVTSTTATGEPLPVDVEYGVYAEGGDRLLFERARTDAKGALTVDVPAEFVVPAVARIEVLAVHRDQLSRVQTSVPGSGPRFVTQLSLDKPLYHPGETVFYRSLTLGRFGLDTPSEVPVHFEIQAPSGAVVGGSELEGITDHGVGNGAFEIPIGLEGGEYTLVARCPMEAFPEEKRTFFIREYRPPQFEKELEFTRDSYGAGDKVVADFSAERIGSGPAAGVSLSIIATTDGQQVFQEVRAASPQGTTQIEFALPAEMTEGDGQLLVTIDDGGTIEPIAKTIPINLGKLDVSFYPEGGDLVAGLENRVYFIAKDKLGEPVHVEGNILDSKGREVAKVEAVHEGMGAFGFTPDKVEKYTLEIDKPAGTTSKPELPSVNADRYVTLSTGEGVFEAGKPIEAELSATKADLPLVVAATCRGVQVAQQAITTHEGRHDVSLPLADEVGGVVRLTVYDYSEDRPEPIAERLVYRKAKRTLNVAVSGHREAYTPGEEVEISLLATDETGEPVAAALGVSVVDQALLSLADDDTPRMTTHFWLTSEVEKPEDLDEADFYLSNESEAGRSLDLLLGTQGWRRFVEQRLEKIPTEAEVPADLKRLAQLGGVAPPPAMVDNIETIKPAYEAELAAYTGDRQRSLDRLAGIAFWGGVGLAIAVGVLAVLRLLSARPVWVPAFATAAACAIVGFISLRADAPVGVHNVAAPFTHYELAVASLQTQVAQTELLADAGGMDGWAENDFLGRWYRGRPLARDNFDVDAASPAWAFFAGAGRREEMDMFAKGGVMLLPMGEADNANLAFDFAARGLGAMNGPMQAMPGAAGMMGGMGGGGFGGGMPGGLARGGAGFGYAFAGDEMELRRLRFAGGARFDRARMAELAEVEAAAEGEERFKVAARLFDEAKVLEEQLASYRFPVREYAHQHVASEPGVRTDFRETLYWQPLLIADATGKASVKFQLSDAVTAFKVNVDAHDGHGRLGDGEGQVISRIPFSVEPRLPLEVSAGDRIDLPIAVNNDSEQEQAVSLSLTASDLLTLEGPAERQLNVAGRGKAREFFSLTVADNRGEATVDVRGQAGPFDDAERQTIKVVPPGFPTAESYAGKLTGEQEVTVKLPQDWVPGSLEVSLAAFPSTLADLAQGMESILQEPTGCFEQASTSNYPNVLTLQYLQEHKVANPELTRRAKELLNTGYGRLTGYECPEKGYEWFGGDPGHEALTAYGLMEFRDMAQVYDVDPTMIQRTADWLLARRDGQGGFQRNERALDSFGAAPPDITNAYVVWALSESGQSGIEKELAHVAELGKKSNDPYLIALAAAGALNAKDEANGKALLDKLAKAQADDGHLDGGDTSITRSGGLSLTVETTSLAALAWLKDPNYHAAAAKAIDWLVESRQGSGGFGSTQATILALKALVEHSKANRRAVAAGELVLLRGDQEIGRNAFGEGHENTISIEGIEGKLLAGDNELVIKLTGDNQMPYTLDVSYRTRTPISHADCPVKLTTELEAPTVKSGETVSFVATLENATETGQPMTVAILGLPAGLETRPDQLEELKKAGAFDYYETRARELICYWRSLAPSRKQEIKLDLVAAYPGRYTAPASRAYLYYTAEQKQWVEPVEVEVSR